jgi:O-antigen ligase
MFEDRVQRLTLEKGDSAGRDEIVQEAYDRGMESPLTGTGLGGSAGVGGSEYPHNLPLELFCEGGIAPVLLLAAALLAFGGACWAYRGTCKAADIATFAAIFVASQFTGDLYDSRAVFAFMILAAVPVDVGRGRPRRSGGDPPARARAGHAASVRPGDSSGG